MASSPTEDEKIAPTAHYTAYAWHRLGMPHGELFATPLGASLFWGFRLAGEGAISLLPGVPSMTQYLELRHRTIERGLEDARPDVVIELGAGLSRRGVTWAAEGVRYVEVDLPEMIAAKRRMIEERAPRALRVAISGRLTHAPVDVLGPGLDDRLRRWIGDAERPVVIAEGLLGYFAMDDRRRAVESVARGLGGRGALLAELRTESGDARLASAVRVLKGAIRLITSGRGTREDFADDGAIRAFFADAGFAAVAPLDPPASLASLPAPTRVWRAAA